MPQFHFRQQLYELKFKLGFTLFCLVIISLCCVLGNWQLYRYHYKKNLLETYQQNKTSQPQPFLQLTGSDATLQFKQVAATGEYQNDWTVILQNKPHKNKIGYEVFTPLKMTGEKRLLLIDRGWVPEEYNHTAPAIPAVKGQVEITGEIKLLNEYQFILGNNLLAQTSPIMMQKMDVKELASVTQQEFYPFVVHLDAADKNGFVREWEITTVMPQRHLAYAVQWFLMAFALCIAYFCFCSEPVKRDDYAEK